MYINSELLFQFIAEKTLTICHIGGDRMLFGVFLGGNPNLFLKSPDEVGIIIEPCFGDGFLYGMPGGQ